MVKEIIDTQTGTCNGCRNCGAGCNCGGMHGYNGHPILRILLALIILGFVFAGGIKLGELKSELAMGYQHRDMMQDGMRMQEYGMYGQGTMAVPVTTTVTTAPAATTTTAK